MHSSGVEQSDTPPCVSALIMKTRVLYMVYLVLFLFLCFVLDYFVFLLVILLFKVAPKHSAEGLCGAPVCVKTVMCLLEKILVLDELCSGMSYSAIDCDYQINI